MNVICLIPILFNTITGSSITLKRVEGTLISQTHKTYLVDFTYSVRKLNLPGSLENYKNMIVQKSQCEKVINSDL